MATSQEVKDAADAVALAKAEFDSAQQALADKVAEALALIPDEQAALDTAVADYNQAYQDALVTVGAPDFQAAFAAADSAKNLAVQALVQATAEYDQQ